jgi:hypothetical protein
MMAIQKFRKNIRHGVGWTEWHILFATRSGQGTFDTVLVGRNGTSCSLRAQDRDHSLQSWSDEMRKTFCHSVGYLCIFAQLSTSPIVRLKTSFPGWV